MTHKGRVGRGTLVAMVVVLAMVVSGCALNANELPGRMPAPVVAGNKTLYFGPQVKQRALRMISASRKFCHLSIYELGDEDVLKALIAARRRGVDVEVVVDATEEQSQTVAVPTLQKGGVKVRSLHVPGGISHIKLLVVDTNSGLEALMGGMNFGRESMHNHDASVYFTHATGAFESVFERDYGAAGGALDVAPAYPSPLVVDRHIEPAMLGAIAQARKNIEIEAFALTSKPFIEALLAAKARGVKVQVVLDPSSSYQKKTEWELSDAGIDARFYRPLQNELLHAKIISIDDGAVFFIGSSNFSRQAFEINHEGDVELTNVAPFGQCIDDDVRYLLSESGAIT